MDSKTTSVLVTSAGVIFGAMAATFVLTILFPITPEPVECPEVPECKQDFYKSNMDYCQDKLLETNELGKEMWEDFYNCYWAFTCTDDKQWCLDNDWTPEQINYTQTLCEISPNYEKYFNKYEK